MQTPKMIFWKKRKLPFCIVHAFWKWKYIFQNWIISKNEIFQNFKKFGNFKNWITFFWKSEFPIKNLQKWPAHKKWSQMEIAMTLSHDAHSHPKWNFNTWRIFCMWQIFISTDSVIKKHVQTGPRHKKSRCPWNGFYLRTSITLRALPSDNP